jgi:hypothetical protein
LSNSITSLLHANIAGILYLQKSMLKIDSSAIRPISATGTPAGHGHIELRTSGQLNKKPPARQALPGTGAVDTHPGPAGMARMQADEYAIHDVQHTNSDVCTKGILGSAIREVTPHLKTFVPSLNHFYATDPVRHYHLVAQSIKSLNGS